ncbi:MAG: HAD-IA family hydrolase [Microgenomates group bacterium]
MIKSVLFDVDGVLLDSYDANSKYVSDLNYALGNSPLPKDWYATRYHVSLKDIIMELSESNDQSKLERLYMFAKTEVPYDHTLLKMPEKIEEVLETLSKKYSLGIVTSRIHKSIYGLPQLKKLKEYFETSVGYEDTEQHKPHPAPLLEACRRLNVLPAEAVYVGDAITDVKAAVAAKMPIIHFAEKPSEFTTSGTFIFSEIPKLVEAIS